MSEESKPAFAADAIAFSDDEIPCLVEIGHFIVLLISCTNNNSILIASKSM